MPEIILNGPEGRIEGRYHPSENNNPPVALVLHPHPLHGGTMNNKVVYNTYQVLAKNGFSVLRINFRGVGRSQGAFDSGIGELADAATALDWLELHNPTANTIWIAGFSFGAWIALQLLMRRPEVQNFITIAPPVSKYDFSFLSPCPTPGLIIQGDQDSIVAEEDVATFAAKISKQKNCNIEYKVISNADHFFRTKMDEMIESLEEYITARLTNVKSVKTKQDRRRRQTQQIQNIY